MKLLNWFDRITSSNSHGTAEKFEVQLDNHYFTDDPDITSHVSARFPSDFAYGLG